MLDAEHSQPRESASRWWERAYGERDLLVAYFSPEFGVDASLPVYSGGLGVLAGDHLKSAGDLGVPLVGVGLFYRQGYFRQSVLRGHQRELYPDLDAAALGLTLERGSDGEPLRIEVDLAGEAIHRSEEHTSELQSQSNLVCR